MKELANRLAMQHLVNAYSQETGQASLFEKYQQNSTQLAFSQGLTLLSLPLSLIQAQLFVPLSYVSRVGRHRIAALPQIFQKGQKLNFSAAAMVSLLLEELVQQSEGHVDAASLVERWIQSRDALQQFLNIRAEDFDALVQLEQGFIESEQALILGHSMHPAPKSRTGFVHEDWQKYSPEACGQTQLHYWLVAPEYIAEGTALEQAFSIQLKQEIKWHLSESELETLAAYAHYKLLPLHPWQARYLQSKAWFKSLKAKLKIIDLGEKAWIFSPTTSVRTLASFNAPWMLKPSLSVMITNSIRVNLAKECHRGEMTHRLWHSELGRDILKQCPTLKAVNDPAWIAIQLDGEIIDETICIVRDQPFIPEQQVTSIASLCQDHPVEERNRFNALFDQIASQQKLNDKAQIAHDWFKTFLNISLSPLMYVYHRYGMAFESHQQNVLVELKDGWPQWLWLRDNQGFYYIEEFADEILQQFPELNDKAHAVGSKAFVDERFSYYFFGNTLFGIINAIGATGFVSEQDLLSVLQQHLFDLLKQYPESSLIQSLLYQPTLPYKGNLLTRLYELDELIAPVENQSVYIQLANPLYIKQEDALYA
ncbi:IucA/IucC family protein [Acinetobacter johnsonii]|uniref:IucA/IucC family protein n=1 Tax=Acinetobacter johnsonii TaxID=40214 RepID=UPI0021673F3E|nr:IucA/IucC family protein [Acinetobacter johnsonii]MCS3527447.1 siderophore synthetase component [Acinetobacter johnsonii]